MCNSFERRSSLVCTYQNVFLTPSVLALLSFFLYIFFFLKRRKKIITKCILAHVVCFKLHPLGKSIRRVTIKWTQGMFIPFSSVSAQISLSRGMTGRSFHGGVREWVSGWVSVRRGSVGVCRQNLKILEITRALANTTGCLTSYLGFQPAHI